MKTTMCTIACCGWLLILQALCAILLLYESQGTSFVRSFSPTATTIDRSATRPLVENVQTTVQHRSSVDLLRRRIRPWSTATSSSLPSTTSSSTSVTSISSNDDDNESAAATTKTKILESFQSVQTVANEYADSMGLSGVEAAIYGLFLALRQAQVPLGLHGQPIVLRKAEIESSFQQSTNWTGFFTVEHLQQAVQDDFLDAARGSTDNRKGWQITDVSVPRGESFEEARMTYTDVQSALDKGTVIFNAAGAHIPRLAGPSLAVTDATALPCALNLYVTASGKRTSAPPHTDKQDVCIIQTSGCKGWKVFGVPDPSEKPLSDIFARGKGDDSLPLYTLSESCPLLVETSLYPGDVLFIPAGFPHTTTTAVGSTNDIDEVDSTATTIPADETSIHLTLGMDHHIWELDYLSVRRLAYRRAGLPDLLSSDTKSKDQNPFVGNVNQLPSAVLYEIMAELPLGLLEEEGIGMVEEIAAKTHQIAKQIDPACPINIEEWRETAERIREQGVELLDIHRDMYLAAIEEGRLRDAEDAMSAHLGKKKSLTMTPERMQRLSLFRVKNYYDQINDSKRRLAEWSMSSSRHSSTSSDVDVVSTVSSDWAFTMPVSVGDQVEADLGGAYFPATVTRASGGTYDVSFFDGDRETGLTRPQIKLLVRPKTEHGHGDVDTSKMTAKQLKRWKKEQQNKQTAS